MQIRVDSQNQGLLKALAESQGLPVNALANRLLDRMLRPMLNPCPATNPSFASAAPVANPANEVALADWSGDENDF